MDREWMMAPADRAALAATVARLKPAVAVEIGTAKGGSLAVLAKGCGKVYSIDIDPAAAKLAADRAFANVEFVTGDSAKVLPALLKKMAKKKEHPTLLLVDGNSETAAVRADIEAILTNLGMPKGETVILMHDSFHPRCRAGIRAAAWAACKYVRSVEVDLTPGTQGANGHLWNGLAIAVLGPKARKGDVQITAVHQMTFSRMMKTSPQKV
jgi:hypothetical protein